MFMFGSHGTPPERARPVRIAEAINMLLLRSTTECVKYVDAVETVLKDVTAISPG